MIPAFAPCGEIYQFRKLDIKLLMNDERYKNIGKSC